VNIGDSQDPSWLSLLDHSKDSLWSIDLFRCESLTLKSYWVLVVMDQYSRRIIGFGIHQGDVDGMAVCSYYINHRTHTALCGLSPAKLGRQATRAFVNINDYGWQQHCHGLFQTPVMV